MGEGIASGGENGGGSGIGTGGTPRHIPVGGTIIHDENAKWQVRASPILVVVRVHVRQHVVLHELEEALAID
jgi:hypothetical protein